MQKDEVGGCNDRSSLTSRFDAKNSESEASALLITIF